MSFTIKTPMKPNKFIALWAIISGFVTFPITLFITEASNQGLASIKYLFIIPLIGLIVTNIIISIIVRKNYPKAKWVIVKITLIYLITIVVTAFIISYLLHILSQ